MRCEAKYVPTLASMDSHFVMSSTQEENETNSLGEECGVCKCLKVSSIQCFCTQKD